MRLQGCQPPAGIPERTRGPVFDLDHPKTRGFEQLFIPAGGRELRKAVDAAPAQFLIRHVARQHTCIGGQEPSARPQHARNFAEKLLTIAKMQDHVD